MSSPLRQSSQCLKVTDPTATTGTARNMPAIPVQLGTGQHSDDHGLKV
jgi:hypothetical protein